MNSAKRPASRGLSRRSASCRTACHVGAITRVVERVVPGLLDTHFPCTPRSALIQSMGSGKMIVEFFSAAMSLSVWR